MAAHLQLPRKKTPNPTDQHVGARVRMRRIMLAMSQEKPGAALNLTFQQVQKYEKGTNRIGAGRLQQLSHVLQVPVEFFFEGAPNASAPHGSNKSELWMARLPIPLSMQGYELRLIGSMKASSPRATIGADFRFQQNGNRSNVSGDGRLGG